MRSGAGAPDYNLALDSALLSSDDDRAVLRLYAWNPAALSLGWFQPIEALAPLARAAGVELVRRPTGGGAIHHADELTFCIIATPGRDGYPAGRTGGYRFVHQIVREALGGLGAELFFRGGDAPLSTRPRDGTLCFEDTTALDLVDGDGRKVVGSAQRHRGGRVLHHGSIPLSVPALSPRGGSIELAAGHSVSWEAVADAIVAGFERQLGGPLVADEPSPNERERAQAARDEYRLEAAPTSD